MVAARGPAIDGSLHEPVGLGARRACADTDPKLPRVSEWLADGLTHADAVSAVAGPNIAIADMLLAGVAPCTVSKARRFHGVEAGRDVNTRSPT